MGWTDQFSVFLGDDEGELFGRLFDEFLGFLENLFQLGILCFLDHRIDHVKNDELGLVDNLGIAGIALKRAAQVMISSQFPGGIDDVLLNFKQCLRFPALALTLALTGLGLAFAEDFFEVAYFSKKEITGRAPDVSFRVDVLSPEVVGNQVARFGFEVLDADEGEDRMFLAAGESFL